MQDYREGLQAFHQGHEVNGQPGLTDRQPRGPDEGWGTPPAACMLKLFAGSSLLSHEILNLHEQTLLSNHLDLPFFAFSSALTTLHTGCVGPVATCIKR